MPFVSLPRPLSMRAKILLLCVSCTLLALALQSLSFMRSASSIVYRQEREANLAALRSMQEELYQWIKSYENDLIKVYNRPDFVRELTQGGREGEVSARSKRVAYDMALTVFDPAQNVNALYIYDMDDRPISVYRSASTPRHNYPEDIHRSGKSGNREIVAAYVRSDERTMLVSSCYNESRKKTLVRFVLKLYEGSGARKIGYLVCDVDSGPFLRIMEKYVLSERQTIWLQGRGDVPIVIRGEEEARTQDRFRIATEEIRRGVSIGESLDSAGSNVLFEMPQRKYAISAFALTPRDILEESQRVLMRNLLVIAVLVVLVATVSATLVTRSLTTPLQGIVRSLQSIREGRTELRLSGLKRDEIGTLGRAINEMLDRIQDLIAQEYRSELLLKQAEYKALQAQVNPHFLYNSLETIGSAAQAGGNKDVSIMCRSLANVFRYSSDMSEPLAEVGEELVHLRNYLHVMNVRVNNEIEFDIEVDPSLLSEKIPRLSLQPLVENALLHGLRNKRGAKRLELRGRPAGSDFVLTVSDNGVGMNAEAVSRRLREGRGEVLNRSSSIGLANIDSRIKLLFGERYGVTVESVAGEGSAVSLRVPFGGTGAA